MNPFAHLLGNEPIQRYLTQSLQAGQLHHALLFSGMSGIGKSLFAFALAKALLGKENHPDLHLLRPEGKSGTHTIEEIRNLIDEVHKPPFAGERKVFILFEADRMLVASANALLKTLEEPSLDTTLILLTDSPQELLPTIYSRCMHLSFQPLTQTQIRAYLQDTHRLDARSAERIAILSNGSLGRAIASLKENPAERLLLDAMDGKMPTWQAIESIDAAVSDLEGLELHQQIDRLLSLYLFTARGRGGIFLQEATEKAIKAKSALQSNVRLSACLDFLLSTS